MVAEIEDLKRQFLSLVYKFDEGTADAQDIAAIGAHADVLSTLSPIPDPVNHLAAVAGSWSNLYASFGTGHSKGKSQHDDSTLALQTFKAFPESPLHVTGILQEIGEDPKLYNNLVFFRTMDDAHEGLIIIHGSYEADREDMTRFNVVFAGAEIRGANGSSDEDLRRCFGFADDYSLKRDIKPARFWSDVVYLDEDLRINRGGMGGLYVLERRLDPPITL